MTVHALDAPRVSARVEVPDDRHLERDPAGVLGRRLDWLRRQVRREAELTLGPHRTSRIYITYEEVAEWPETTTPAA